MASTNPFERKQSSKSPERDSKAEKPEDAKSKSTNDDDDPDNEARTKGGAGSFLSMKWIFVFLLAFILLLAVGYMFFKDSGPSSSSAFRSRPSGGRNVNAAGHTDSFMYV